MSTKMPQKHAGLGRRLKAAIPCDSSGELADKTRKKTQSFMKSYAEKKTDSYSSFTSLYSHWTRARMGIRLRSGNTPRRYTAQRTRLVSFDYLKKY